MLLLAVNVGLILRVVYDGESQRVELSIHDLCFEQQNKHEASMPDSFEKDGAHQQQEDPFPYSSVAMGVAGGAVVDGGQQQRRQWWWAVVATVMGSVVSVPLFLFLKCVTIKKFEG